MINQWSHVAIQEGQQQCANVLTVDIGICHQNTLVIARLVDVKLFADAGSEGGDDCLHFGVGKHAVETRTLNVQDFSAKRQDRLSLWVATTHGRTTCRVTLNDVDL